MFALPKPLAAGGGDVVVLAAGVDGSLDFSFAALWRKQRGDFGVTCVIYLFFSLQPGTITCKETTSHNSTLIQL